MICPICKGSGRYEPAAHADDKLLTDTLAIKKRIANELSESGYSVRQIMKALGYKSPRSISLLIEKKKN